MKKLWNSLTAIVLLSSLGITGASHARSNPTGDRQSEAVKETVSQTLEKPELNGHKLPSKSPIVPQGSKHHSGGYYGGYYEGYASWYGPGFHGNLTANGEIYDQYAMTAAHPSLPFGTWVYVTNLDNGAGVTVRINDRGPYAGGRIIDLSLSAAEAIGMIDSGVAYVAVEILN